MTKKQLKAYHKFSDNNRTTLTSSYAVGCFYCIQIYSPRDIVEWIDKDQTALCPRCGIDAVLCSNGLFMVDIPFLEQMNSYWFRTTKVVMKGGKLVK